jgi:two-component system phosphate regulon sensor histidine kinase PhoR
VKRIFTIITVLISLSLAGIIIIQVSWIKNMLLLRQGQIKQKIDEVTTIVGQELALYKGIYSSNNNRLGTTNIFKDEFSLEFTNPVSVGQRFSVEEISQKIAKAFEKVELKNSPFEFQLAVVSSRTGVNMTIERQSKNFIQVYGDTLNNYSHGYFIVAPSGSPGEGLDFNETLIVVVPDVNRIALKSLTVRIATSLFFTLIIIAAFYLTVRTMIRQKKMGEIKNDFINNMTHEFKTPIATISLAVDAMRNEKVRQDQSKMTYFSDIIKEENQRMNRQVETILKASQLERQEVDLNLNPAHLHDIIKDVVDNFTLQLEDKGGKIELQLNAANDTVNADEVHMSNLVNNLVDNALKYSKENTPPVVRLSTQSNGKNLTLRIEDNGIGMNRETLKRIFERFYRAHTGNIHNVKGFGLGLSYVKTMVEAHGGIVKADSTLGKGSTFIIELPLTKS